MHVGSQCANIFFAQALYALLLRLSLGWLSTTVPLTIQLVVSSDGSGDTGVTPHSHTRGDTDVTPPVTLVSPLKGGSRIRLFHIHKVVPGRPGLLLPRRIQPSASMTRRCRCTCLGLRPLRLARLRTLGHASPVSVLA